jgi:hypothetical protein
MTVSIAPNRITHMDELSFPGTPHPEGYISPIVPFPPVEAYSEDDTHPDATTAFLMVRESLDTHLMDLLDTVRAMRTPATQEDVRRLSLVRTVVLGALGTLA